MRGCRIRLRFGGWPTCAPGRAALAILLARHFRRARVDAIDVSPGALAVAEINVRRHRLAKRVFCGGGDVFDSVAPARYDVIVSNPPYDPRRGSMRFRRNSEASRALPLTAALTGWR